MTLSPFVSALVVAVGGTIEARVTLDHGMTMRVLLPARSEQGT